MGVEDVHASYEAFLPIWGKCRDVVEGEEAVKTGERYRVYLPPLGNQNEQEYGAYKNRASLYNATARTVEGLSGMVFRRAVTVQGADSFKRLMEDVTIDGMSIQALAEHMIDEILVTGRFGILLEFPNVNDAPATVAERQRHNVRPYLATYGAESITNWRFERVDNKLVLFEVRLFEVVMEQGDDEFEHRKVEQYRVLDLMTGVYRQRIYRYDEDQRVWVQYGEDVYPRKNGEPLTRIPFRFISSRGSSNKVHKPPILDLVNKNLDHYRMDADYKHGLHFVALPTPWATGVQQAEDDEGKFGIVGPDASWITANKDARFGMLEFTGAGLNAIRQALTDAKSEMAMLGARMLAPERRVVEAAETASIHRVGEQSVLASIVGSVSLSLTDIVTEMAEWADVPSEGVSVTLNKDFLPTPLPPQAVESLMHIWQAGGMSWEVLFENLKRGEYIPIDVDPDEEANRINNPKVEPKVDNTPPQANPPRQSGLDDRMTQNPPPASQTPS